MKYRTEKQRKPRIRARQRPEECITKSRERAIRLWLSPSCLRIRRVEVISGAG